MGGPLARRGILPGTCAQKLRRCRCSFERHVLLRLAVSLLASSPLPPLPLPPAVFLICPSARRELRSIPAMCCNTLVRLQGIRSLSPAKPIALQATLFFTCSL